MTTSNSFSGPASRMKQVDWMSRASTFTFVVFATAAHAAPMEVDTDLLEFLGEWATDDGGWIDPGNHDHTHDFFYFA